LAEGFSQTKKAMDIANQSAGSGPTLRTRKSSSSRSPPPDVEDCGCDLEGQPHRRWAADLVGLSGIVGRLTDVVKWIQAIPGPIKTVLKYLANLIAITGPIMMFIGIIANWVGIHYQDHCHDWPAELEVQDAQPLDEAAQNSLEQTATQTTDKAAQAQATLALRMQELIKIMESALQLQNELNAAQLAGTEAEKKNAIAAVTDAGAQSTAAKATEVRAEAQQSLNALSKNAIATMRAVPTGPGEANVSAPGVYNPLSKQTIGTGAFAVDSKGSATYSPNASDVLSRQVTESSKRRAEAFAKLEASRIGTMGTQLFTAAEDGTVLNQKDGDALRAKFNRNMSMGAKRLAASAKNVAGSGDVGELGSRNDYARLVAPGASGFKSVSVDVAALTSAGKTAGDKIVSTVETSLMDELVAMSGEPMANRGMFARIGDKIKGRTFESDGTQVNRMGSLPAVPGAAAASIAESAKKTEVSWGKVAGNVGALSIGAMMMKNMATTSNSVSDNLMQGALAFSMIAPVAAQALSKIAAIKAAQAGGAGVSLIASGWTKIRGLVGIAGNAVKTLFTTPLGIAGVVLTGIAVAWVGINNYMSRASRRQEDINKSTQNWQSILGYTAKSLQEIGENYDKANSGDRWKALTEGAKQLKEQNEGLADALGEAYNNGKGLEKVYNMAVSEALKVKVDGGSAQQAKMAFDVALQTAGLNTAEINQLDMRIKDVNLDDPAQVAQMINDQISAAMANTGPGSGFHLSGGWDRDLVNLFITPFNNDAEGFLGDDATAMFNNVGQQVSTALSNAIQNGDKGQVDSAVKALKGGLDKSFEQNFADLRSSGDNARIFKEAGVSTMTGLRDAIVKASKDKAAGNPLKQWESDLLDLHLERTSSYKEYYQAWKDILTQIGQASGLSGKPLDNFIHRLQTLGLLSGEFKGKIGGAGDAADAAGNQAEDAAGKFDSLADAMKTGSVVASGEQYANAMKSAYGGVVTDYVSGISQAFQNMRDASIKGMNTAEDARQKGFDKQLTHSQRYYDAEDKKINRHYDKLGKTYDADMKLAKDTAQKKIDGINKEIDAIQKQDTARQELFDNEKKRIQRMAEMQNNNIDFNAALNLGNVDEAAKIYANNQVTVQGWAMDDQQAAMDKASKARVDSLQGKITAVEKDRDAYVDSIQKKKDALDDLKQKELDNNKALAQADQDRINRMKDADKTATQNRIDAANRQFDAQKQMIDRGITAITASIPMTVGGIKKQIGQIDGQYQNYGYTLKGYTNRWGDNFGNSLKTHTTEAVRSLQSDVGWKQIGDYIQSQIDNGAGYTLDQALSFLRTGKWPADKSRPKIKPWSPALKSSLHESGLGMNTKFNINGVARASHSGGPAGAGGGGMTHASRVGVPLNAPLFPSEYLTVLRQGEFVVNKGATDQNRHLLEAINSGQLIARHSGGAVGGGMIGGMILGQNSILHAGLMRKAATDALANAFMGSVAGGGFDAAYTAGVTKGISDTLSFGRQQQGKPYIWGGAGPQGQDCSGFMSILYNYMTGHSPGGNSFPWGRDWTTSSFAGGREFGPWKRDSRGDGSHRFRIGVMPGSHMAGTLGGIHVESGSGHGPRVGGNALGADDPSFPYQYYLPLADLPQLYKGGTIQYDNTLANLHKGETVLTKPLTETLSDNVENGFGKQYNVEVHVNGPINGQVDFEQGVYNALYKLEGKNGRKRVVK
jgi:hypothetical protein